MEATGVSKLSRYASRNMIAYIAFSLPAVALELLFSFSVSSNPNLGSLGSDLGVIGQVLVIILTVIPWLVVAASVYAIVIFRSSVVLTLLVVGYFLSSAVQGTVASPSGLFLDPTTTAVAVVVATFLALIAFGFARSVKIRGRDAPVVQSGGSVLFQLLGLSFDFLVPAVIAVVLVGVTIGMFGAVKEALTGLPPPLSQIFSSNLVSPILAVGATLAVAGITLWTVRELIEPWVMYYAITREDATKLLLQDLKSISKPKETTIIKNGNGILTTGALIVGILFGTIILFGPAALLKNLPTLLFGHSESYRAFVAQTNSLFNEIQNTVNEIIRLLWG